MDGRLSGSGDHQGYRETVGRVGRPTQALNQVSYRMAARFLNSQAARQMGGNSGGEGASRTVNGPGIQAGMTDREFIRPCHQPILHGRIRSVTTGNKYVRAAARDELPHAVRRQTLEFGEVRGEHRDHRKTRQILRNEVLAHFEAAAGHPQDRIDDYGSCRKVFRCELENGAQNLRSAGQPQLDRVDWTVSNRDSKTIP